jgi:RNA polymerase sigma-70 factor (ECF subfamily)
MADAEQEILISLWTGLDRFRFASSFRTFLYRLCRNKAIDLLRRESRHRRRAEAAATESRTAPVIDPADGLEHEDRRRRVAAALGRLDPEERLLVVMKDIEAMSIEEISASLGVRPGTVKSRLHRTRDKLARTLGKGALP